MTSQLEIVKGQKTENDKLLARLRNELKTYKLDSMSFKQLCDEIKVLQPDVEEVTFAKGQKSDFSTYGRDQSLVIIEWKNKTRDQKNREEYLHTFLKLRMKNDSLRVVDIVLD